MLIIPVSSDQCSAYLKALAVCAHWGRRRTLPPNPPPAPRNLHILFECIARTIDFERKLAFYV